MSFIFGGSKSKQQSTSQAQSDAVSQNASWNRSYGDIRDIFKPLAEGAHSIQNSLRDFLGLGQGGMGYDTYKQNTGFDWAAEQGGRGLFSNAAAQRMLDSGGTRKAMMQYGTNINNQSANNYIDKLSALLGLSQNAGQLLSQAGQTSYGDSASHSVSNSQSTGSSSETKGLGGFLGAILTSDRRAKEDIVKVGDIAPGLHLYEFKYKGKDGREIGVMADEVAKTFPEALGPKTAEGYQTVDYGKLNELVGAL